MENLVLQAQKRAPEEKVKYLRQQRIVPANVYGKTQNPISLKIDASDMLRTHRIAGWSHIVVLSVEWEEIEVLFQEIQKAPVSGEIIHADFYALTRWEKLTTKIPVMFVWNSLAVKEWALLNENVKEIEISCLPRDLIDSFEADLSLLKEFDDVIRVSDLWINEEKYEIHNLHPEDAIAVASKPKVAEDLSAPVWETGEAEWNITDEEKTDTDNTSEEK